MALPGFFLANHLPGSHICLSASKVYWPLSLTGVSQVDLLDLNICFVCGDILVATEQYSFIDGRLRS